MASYRDDYISTARVSSSVFTRLFANAETLVRIATTTSYGLFLTATVQAAASTATTERQLYPAYTIAQVSVEILGQKQAQAFTEQSAKVSNQLTANIFAPSETVAGVQDASSYSLTAFTVNNVQIDSVIQQSVLALDDITTSAKVSDKSIVVFKSNVTQAIVTETHVTGRLHAINNITSTVAANTVIQLETQNQSTLTATAQVSSDNTGKLYARNFITSTAQVETGQPSNNGYVGQAWTVNTENWALSRYEPYTFEHLAVIDGVAYGCNDDGVFRLDAQSESISAKIKTAMLDMSGKEIVHPVAVYFNHEMAPNAKGTRLEMATFQRGTLQSYSYPLNAGRAESYRTGRFVLGRGLRSRHFSLTLTVAATTGTINDITVDVAATARRM